MLTDPDRCYRVLAGRDRRFDGMFYVGVTSTGIYCRPSCPARTPRRENTRFYPSAAAAQDAGFRACRRCRPEAVPGSPDWDVAAAVSGRAMRLIGDGVVDREGVPGLAGRLGYSPRQLHRLLVGELGAGPLALARARRAQTARTLVESTAMSLADVAFAAGFSSVRQFNATMQEVYGVPAARAAPRRAAADAPAQPGRIELRLACRPAVRRRRARCTSCGCTASRGVEDVGADGDLGSTAAPCGCRTAPAPSRCVPTLGRPRVRRRDARGALHPAPVRPPRRRPPRSSAAGGWPTSTPIRRRCTRCSGSIPTWPPTCAGTRACGCRDTPTASSSPRARCSASR